MAGQSNMEGQAFYERKNDTTGEYLNGTFGWLVKDPRTKDEFAKTIDADGSWTVRDDVWVWYNERQPQAGDLTVGWGSKADKIGPEYGFGFEVGDAIKDQVLLLKVAWGGKSLAHDFLPPSDEGGPGPYYSWMIGNMTEALANLKTIFPAYDEAKGYELAGFAWHQGWNDGCNGEAFNYEGHLVSFIKDVRKDLDAPGLPFSIGVSGFGGWGQKIDRRLAVANAQLAMANATKYPEFAGNVITMETRGFFREAQYSPGGQGYHWNNNAETYYLLGQAMGKGMLQLLGLGRQDAVTLI
jgi:alpha-galactosidase